MLIRSILLACTAAVTLSACSAIEDEVVTYLEGIKIRNMDEEQGQTRFRNLGDTTLQLMCTRTGEKSGTCYTVPITGKYQSCMTYQVDRKTSTDLATVFLGKLTRVTSTGAIPAAQCPR